MTWMSAFVASLHFLALGIGLGSIYVRARAFQRVAKGEPAALATALTADNFWGIAALLWIGSGQRQQVHAERHSLSRNLRNCTGAGGYAICWLRTSFLGIWLWCFAYRLWFYHVVEK